MNKESYEDQAFRCRVDVFLGKIHQELCQHGVCNLRGRGGFDGEIKYRVDCSVGISGRVNNADWNRVQVLLERKGYLVRITEGHGVQVTVPPVPGRR